MKKLIFTFLLLTSLLSANNYEQNILNDSDNIKVYRILRENNLEIGSKSLKGWIRLFNSKERMNDYNIYINKEDRLEILKFFKYKYEIKQNKYKRGIQ